MAEARAENTPDGAGKTCGTCGVRYLKRHNPCLAVLQKPKRVRKTAEQLKNHEKMMVELYRACPGMKKRLIPDEDDESDERLVFKVLY